MQQLADALCRCFCGRHLLHDRRALSRLGSGKLEIDLAKRFCRFEHHFIPRLAVFDRLTLLLRNHLADHGVEPDAVRSARLSVELEIDEHERQSVSHVMWFGDCSGFVGCRMRVECTVNIEDDSYKSEHRGYVEWPRD